MRRNHSILKSLALAGILSASGFQSAFAWEADAVTERYKTLLSDQGITVTWSGVREDGNSIILEGLKVGLTGVDKPVALGDITLADVSETDTIYTIGNITIESFTHSDEDMSVKLSDMQMSGLILPKAGADNPYGGLLQYGSFELANAELTIKNATVLTLENLRTKTELQGNGGALAFNGSAERFFADLGTLSKGDEARATLKKYGYEQITGRVDMEGNWNPEDGRTVLSNYDIAVDDAGTIGLSLDISGYTPEFIKKLQDVQAKMQDGDEGQQQVQGMAMLGLMQSLNLHGASVRFSDASLTGKVLDFAASKQGAKPSDIANQAKAILPLMAGQYLGSELTQALTAAATEFLDNPKNIEIRIAPESPLPFPVIMGAAMGSPEALAKQLGVKITANE